MMRLAILSAFVLVAAVDQAPAQVLRGRGAGRGVSVNVQQFGPSFGPAWPAPSWSAGPAWSGPPSFGWGWTPGPAALGAWGPPAFFQPGPVFIGPPVVITPELDLWEIRQLQLAGLSPGPAVQLPAYQQAAAGPSFPSQQSFGQQSFGGQAPPRY
jgi:hypothetical protein